MNPFLFATVLLQSLPLFLIFLFALKDWLKYRFSVILGFVVCLAFALCTLASVIVDSSSAASYTYAPLLSSLLTTVFLIILVFIVTDLPLSQNVFIVVLMMNIADNIMLMVFASYPRINPADLTPDGSYFLRFFVFSLFVIPFFYFFINKMLLPWIQPTRLQSIWKYICYIPVAFFAICHIALTPCYLLSNRIWHYGLALLPFIWTLGTFTVYFLVVRSLSIVFENTQLEDKLHYTALLATSQEKQYLSLRNHITATRQTRHDLRHFLVALQGYAKSGDCESILQALDSRMETLVPDSGAFFCENTALNAILGYYYEMAKEAGIETTLSIHVPKELIISDTDVCLLVGNLFENAVEACRRQSDGRRFLKLSMEMSSPRILSFILANSYSGTIRKDGGKYSSSKRDGYGIGLSSIQQIIDKNNGIIRIGHANQVFSVSVMLYK